MHVGVGKYSEYTTGDSDYTARVTPFLDSSITVEACENDFFFKNSR